MIVVRTKAKNGVQGVLKLHQGKDTNSIKLAIPLDFSDNPLKNQPIRPCFRHEQTGKKSRPVRTQSRLPGFEG